MILLQRPRIELVASYLDSVAEMRSLGEKIWDGMAPRATESPSNFVQRLLRGEHGAGVDRVPESVYWAVLDDVVVGRIALRHHLNAGIEEVGGQVGYEVRPSVSREGIATEMLRLLLDLRPPVPPQ